MSDPEYSKTLKSSTSKEKVKVKKKKHQKNPGSSDTPPKRPRLEEDHASPGPSTTEVEATDQPSYPSENTGKTIERCPSKENVGSAKVPKVDSDPENSDNDYEGLDEPPIRRQLQNILRQYPDGPQIIRELVQNAEDAKASVFKVMLQTEDNMDENRFNSKYHKMLLGPGLCAYNDSVFKDKDWKGIKSIYTSVKEADALTIGRFGLGFKSVFHLTDTPLILSGNKLLIINPTEDPRRVCHNVTLTQLTSKYRETLLPVLTQVFKMDRGGTFGFDTTALEKNNYQGSLFWFPLRRAPSSLLDKVYTSERMKELMDSFREEADTILLFLQNIDKITIMENESQVLYEVTLKEDDSTQRDDTILQEFSKNRKHIKIQLKDLGTKVPENSISVTYNAQLVTNNVKEGQKKTAIYKIVNYYQGTKEMSSTMRGLLSEDEENVPLVGVAFPMQLDKTFVAHVFCFLPLPFTSSSLTNLPVHVNGFFNLDPSRDHVMQATAGQVGEKEKRIQWNELLIGEVIPKAYIKLIEDLLEKRTKAEIVYGCLPDIGKVHSDLWKLILPPLHRMALQMNIFQTEKVKETWVNIENAVFNVFEEKERTTGQEIKNTVIDLIRDYNENLVLLPEHLITLILSWTENKFIPSVCPKLINSKYVASLMSNDSLYRKMSRKNKIKLLDYFLTYAELASYKKLELIPTNDEHFFLSLISDDQLYLCTEEETFLFPNLERQLLSDMSDEMAERLLELPCGNIKRWSSAHFVPLLRQSIEVGLLASSSKLDLEAKKTWIKKVWTFLSEIEKPYLIIKQIESFPVLLAKEDKKGSPSLHVLRGNHILTKINNLQPLSNEVKEVLRCCGVTLLEEIFFLPKFAMEKFVRQPTVKDVCMVLETFQGNKSNIKKINNLSARVRKEFASFFVQRRFQDDKCKMTENLKKWLKKLELFPLSNVPVSSSLYAVEKVDGIAQYHMKEFPVKYDYLLLERDFQGISLAFELGCQEFPVQKLITETLQRVRERKYQSKEVTLFMDYFMNKLDDNTPAEQIEIASKIPFIENGVGELKAPSDLFDPSIGKLKNLFLGEENSFFPKECRKNFIFLGKLQKLKIKSDECIAICDLINTVQYIEDKNENLKDVELKKKIQAIFMFFKDLSQNAKDMFVKEVREKRWIPVMTKRSKSYPKRMKWKGEDARVCKPSEACSQKYELLVGSVCCVSNCAEEDDLLEELLIRPNTHLVLKQLIYLTKKYKESKKSMEYDGMLKEIYEYLAEQELTKDDLSILEQEDVVPTKSSFTNSSKVYIDFLPYVPQILLEPHTYQINEKWVAERKVRNFFVKIGCKETLTCEYLISVQENIKNYHSLTTRSGTEIRRDLKYVADILSTLKDMKEKISNEESSRILFPVQTKTKQLVLMPALQCTYTDEKHTEFLEEMDNEAEAVKIHFVHEDIGVSVAECFGVPSLTRREMENGGIEDLEYEQWGQQESLTTRIKNILKDYSDGPLFKEMLQNADDAGATCMKILYDERKNEDARSGLIDKGMEECQGPALWFYNDAKFKEKDFKNIIKLGGGTKENEHTKIGKFGLGFCSVYSVTDVPSIVSGKYIVYFDPRTIHLGKAIKNKSNPGLRIPISKIVKKFRKQFMPYDKIFNCDFTEEDEYEGTLFRLPLRTAEQASDDPDGISTKQYNRQEVISVVKKFMDSAGNLLLFTQNVKKIELYFLNCKDDPDKSKLLYSVEKKYQEQCANIFDQMKAAVLTGEEEFSRTFEFDIDIKLSQNLSTILDLEFGNLTGSFSSWIVSWAALQIPVDLQGPLLLASTAMPLSFSLETSEEQNVPYGFFNTGHVFCFLPLPQKSQMKVHLNGKFAVEQSRKSIVLPTSSEEPKAHWNDLLISNVLSKAYLNMLENVELPSAEYYTFWPISREGNVFNSLVSNFYAEICHRDIKVFFSGGNSDQKFSLKECIFLDSSLQNDHEVGKTAYEVFALFNPFSENVMFMPSKIQEEFMTPRCKPYFLKQICSEERFFFKVFLKSLEKDFWESDERKIIRRSLLKRIFCSENRHVLSNLRNIECIPTKPNGRLRKPTELVNEYSHLLRDMFSDLDERFPEDELHDVKKTLEELGMNTESIPDEILIERACTIKELEKSNFELAEKRCIALVIYISQCHASIPQTTFDKLRNIPFLPVMTKPYFWPCSWLLTDIGKFAAPSMLYTTDCKFLIGSVKEILDESRFICSKDDLFNKLAIKRWNDVHKIFVLEQLKKIADIGKETMITGEEADNLKKICKDVYHFLNIYGLTSELKIYQRSPCILVQVDAMTFKLVEPYFTSTNPMDDVPPYIHRIDESWSTYEYFLNCVGVHHEVKQEMIIDILNSIDMIEGGKVDNLPSVVKLYNLMKDSVNLMPNRRLLPDLKGIMRLPEEMCFEDGNDKISTADHLHFTHRDINIRVCKLFKVASKSAKFIKKFSSGVSFGQKEKLVTRLRHILDDYPCDISILNELVQNADDANATEIHFVYDKQHHPEKGLFDDSMKCLQGPALVVYNNSCFSKEDIDGISELGEGSKSFDPDKTGQFGIGFNAVYQITDAPSFLTKGQKTPNGGSLIMFDPHCRYVPDATPENPGLRVDDLKCVKERYTGVYNSYLQNKLPANSGTWFRFPLRTKEMAKTSHISKYGEIKNSHMLNILKSFQKEMSKSLLFLKNLRCIRVSEIDESGDMLTLGEVRTFVTENDSIRIEEFQSKCKEALLSLQNGVRDLGSSPGFSCDYCIELIGKAGEEEWHEHWALSNVFGTMKETCVKGVLRKGYKNRRINLLPRAGIAACLKQTKRKANQMCLESENSDEILEETMQAFCFLPLPLVTGFPVHINGQFALDSNRTNIWINDQESAKGSWNELILNEVLPFAYISAMQYLQQILFTGQSLHSDSIRRYNNYFPVMKHIKDDIWKRTVRMFYNKVFSNDINLFPLLFDKETFESMRNTDCILASGALEDKENSAVVFVPLKSKQHHFPAYFDGISAKSENEREFSDIGDHTSDVHSLTLPRSCQNTKQLLHILKVLGLKLLSSSTDILESIQVSLERNTPHSPACTPQNISPKAVDIGDILQFLLSWDSKHVDKCRIDKLPMNIKNTVFMDVSKVKLLLEFCLEKRENNLEGVPLCVLESGSLTCFSKSSQKIVSKFCHLLEHSKDIFVCKSLVPVLENMLPKKVCPGIIELTIKTIAELLQKNIPSVYCSREPIKWKEGISSQWLNDFWEFLSTQIYKEAVENCKEYLSEWCLVPTEDRSGQQYLYPFQLAYAVVSSNLNWENKNIFGLISRLGFPKLRIQRQYEGNKLSAYLCASELSPENILAMFIYHKHLYYKSIDTSEANQILAFLLAKLHKEVKDRDPIIISKFRNACLFQTIDEHVTDLTTKEVVILKEENSFPQTGLNAMCEILGIIMLKRNEWLEDFEIRSMYQEDFYADIFFKKASLLDKFTVEKHMEHIMKTKLYLRSRLEEMKELISEIAWIKNEITDNYQKPREFYSPHVEVCKLLCTKEDLLPEKMNNRKWKKFLEFLGLKKDVPFDLLLEFGRKIESHSVATVLDATIQCKSNVLWAYILQQKLKCKGFDVFMRHFRKIKCILPFKVSENLSILPQSNTGSLICFEGSVLSSMWDISWSCCNLVPKETVKDINHDILGVKSKPDVVNVISHIHKLCSHLQNSLHFEKFQQMKRVYENLETFLERSFSASIEELKQGLIETPFIYDVSADRFRRPYEVALLIDTGKCIDDYLCKGPEKYGNFNDLFRKIGVCDQPIFYHYLRIFFSLHQTISSNKMTPKELDTARKAFIGLLESLRLENCNVSQLPLLIDLYLPSDDDELILSTDIVLCDRPSFKGRMKAFKMKFLRTNSLNDIQTLGKLPARFKPKLLSELFTEQVEKGPDCENDQMISRISKVLHSEAFFNGIWRFVRKISSPPIKESRKQRIKQAFQNIRIKKVAWIRTILVGSSGAVESSIKEKSVYYERSEGRVLLYIKTNPTSSFKKCFEEWKWKLCQVVRLCAEGLLSNDQFEFIQELLKSKSDNEIMEICKKHEIELDESNWQPSPGTSIPVGLHDLLDNTFCEFSEGDIAAYERIDPLTDIDSNDDIRVFESEFIYVRIIEKEKSPTEMFPKYIVFDGENDVKVCSIRLFKFVRKTEKPSTELELFSAERIHTSELSLDTIKADIKRRLIAAWKLSRSDKRAVIKRLLLQWHPDKNLTNKDQATEVTQFILDVIGKLERGEIGVESYSAGYSASSSSSYHYGTSYNWTFFQEQVNRCYNRRRKRYNDYSTWTSGGSSTRRQRPPNPQPAVGLQWIKQAKYDIIAANQQLKFCSRPMNQSGGESSSQNEDAVTSWNWICYKAHQACEKAMKAALYSMDANIASDHQTSHDLSSLSSALSSVTSLSALVVRFSNEITGQHTAMRYPTGGRIPGDSFTHKQAEKAIDIAQQVLEECENCVS